MNDEPVYEFVITFKDGSKDWIDPVDEEDIIVDHENQLLSVTGYSHVYEYDLNDVVDWQHQIMEE